MNPNDCLSWIGTGLIVKWIGYWNWFDFHDAILEFVFFSCCSAKRMCRSLAISVSWCLPSANEIQADCSFVIWLLSCVEYGNALWCCCKCDWIMCYFPCHASQALPFWWWTSTTKYDTFCSLSHTLNNNFILTNCHCLFTLARWSLANGQNVILFLIKSLIVLTFFIYAN